VSDERSKYEFEVLRAVEEVAADVVESGRAELGPRDEWGPGVYALRPTNPDACPVVVQVDFEEQVTLYFGRHATVMELYDKDMSKLLEGVRKYVKAALEGRYEERVRLRRSDESELGKAKGVFRFDDRDHKIAYSDFRTLGGRGPWEHIRYGPY
jgi:hypothetical protein